MPIWPCAPPKISNMDVLGMSVEYSVIWNTTGFPAGVMPVTTVQANEQFHTDAFNDNCTKAMNETNQDSKGLPLHIQVVGHPYEDEKVLGIMKTLEQHIGYKVPMPPKD